MTADTLSAEAAKRDAMFASAPGQSDPYVAGVLQRLKDYSTLSENGCWTWTRGTNDYGYGQLSVRAKTKIAHRVSYEFLVQEIPTGLFVDHLCRNRACINPNHMELVTNRENVLRGVGPTARNAKVTHCKNGHALTPDNVMQSSRNYRPCKTCSEERKYQRRINVAKGMWAAKEVSKEFGKDLCRDVGFESVMALRDLALAAVRVGGPRTSPSGVENLLKAARAYAASVASIPSTGLGE